ncbi:low molecular weight protein-tyrosine-phosphatase [Arenimonas fontis]|uniref:protein-tyrosine-phosphatase n=1 Tax=Arenimonas fontis TaxID=2608255 RepID=A0A5B2Z937_9GAMM|nr:low molecular weight protein-tyrosine-phosphatase [Arenimonas fontis]KAA2284427.1 low molecular weight phosphotyrosine protein phosphatase [Arenimonas fontis]
MKILFVCMGNICRSPLLEGWARQVLGDTGLVRLVDSAGTGAWHAGQPPDPRAVAVAARYGLDISGLRARQVRADDFQGMDLILCADRDNQRELLRRAPPDARARIALALDWAGVQAGGEVPDPYYGSAADFERVNALCRDAAEGLLRRLRGQA